MYDKTTGITEVYVDDVFIDSWQDLTPLTVGNFVSFRSGDCAYDVDELRIYHSRTGTETILVGSAAINDIRYENNPTTSGIIRSIAIDTAHNISTIATEMVDVDFITTSVDELKANAFTIYPNPAKESITIEFSQLPTGQLTITDIAGKQVKLAPLNSIKKQTFSITELAKGIYFLNYNNQTVKLVKE